MKKTGIFVLTFLFLAVSGLQSCKEKKEGAPQPETVWHYIIESDNENIVFSALGSLQDNEIPHGTEPAGKMVPWPHAPRITDINQSEKKVYCLVNRAGITQSPDFSLKGRDLKGALFNSYTAGYMVKNRGELFAHLYLNAFFDDTLSGKRITLESPFIRILPDGAGVANSVFEYPETNLSAEGYYLVDLKRNSFNVGAVVWVSAWKRSSAEAAEFRYYSHENFLGRNSRQITEALYRQSASLLSQTSLPTAIKNLAAFLIEKNSRENTVVDMVYRDKKIDYPFSCLVAMPDAENGDYSRICATAEGEKYFASYDRNIYSHEEGDIFCFSGVEELPEKYSYTALFACNGLLYAAWEEQSFFLTGRAGLSIIDIERVDKIRQ